MITCRGPSEDQLPNPLPILDSIVQCQEAPEAASADDGGYFSTSKMMPDTLDIIDNLVKRIWFGVTTLAVATIVKRQDSIARI